MIPSPAHPQTGSRGRCSCPIHRDPSNAVGKRYWRAPPCPGHRQEIGPPVFASVFGSLQLADRQMNPPLSIHPQNRVAQVRSIGLDENFPAPGRKEGGDLGLGLTDRWPHHADLDLAVEIEHGPRGPIRIDQQPLIFAPAVLSDFVGNPDPILPIHQQAGPGFELPRTSYHLQFPGPSIVDRLQNHVVIPFPIGVPRHPGGSPGVHSQRRRPVVGGMLRDLHFGTPAGQIVATVENLRLPPSEALPGQVKSPLIVHSRSLIEVPFRVAGKLHQRPPLVTIEPAPEEIEIGRVQVLLGPDDPGSLSRHDQRGPPHVTTHSGHQVPGSPFSCVRVAAGQVDFIAPSSVAGPGHPHFFPVSGIGSDDWEVIAACIVAETDHVLKAWIRLEGRCRLAPGQFALVVSTVLCGQLI